MNKITYIFVLSQNISQVQNFAQMRRQRSICTLSYLGTSPLNHLDSWGDLSIRSLLIATSH